MSEIAVPYDCIQLENGVEVSVHEDLVREHLLLVVEKGVGAEILGKIHALVHRSGAMIPAHDAVLKATHVRHSHYLLIQREREREREKACVFFFFFYNILADVALNHVSGSAAGTQRRVPIAELIN
ncbi:hypothetical protein I3843_01G164200 [Carya illinoinensis]|nr:hypothetical protein I3843_01G164200 [Carya illinoinensis]